MIMLQIIYDVDDGKCTMNKLHDHILEEFTDVESINIYEI